jgi:hypothetical protein
VKEFFVQRQTLIGATTGFGRLGAMAGEFRALHNIASDSRGNLYTTEAGIGRQLQKFVRAD